MTERQDSPARDMMAYYGSGGERARLSTGRGQLGRFRTQEILTRHLPLAPATVLDVGGAAGVYSL